MSDTQAAETAADTMSDEDMWAAIDAEEGGDVTQSRADIGGELETHHADDFDEEGSEPAGDEDPAGDEPSDTVDKSAEAGDDKETVAEPAAPNIWDTAPPELRKEFEALQQRERSAAGRAVSFQRRFEELKKAAEPRPVDDKRPTREAALAAIREDYPEIAEPLSQALASIEGDVQDLTSREESRRMAAQADLDAFVQQETDMVKAEHPDYLETLQTHAGRFQAWIEDQPKATREAFDRNREEIVNGAEAAAIVSAFKAHLSPPATPARTQSPSPLSSKRERQLGSTASPATRGRRPTTSGIPEDGDPQDIWDAFEAAERR